MLKHLQIYFLYMKTSIERQRAGFHHFKSAQIGATLDGLRRVSKGKDSSGSVTPLTRNCFLGTVPPFEGERKQWLPQHPGATVDLKCDH